MPRFYLHLEDGDGSCLDEEGFDAVGLSEAWAIIATHCWGFLAFECSKGISLVSFYLCLDDAKGKRLATVPIQASIGPSIS